MDTKKSFSKYVIGLDFGTDSVRALIVDVENGREIATHVSNYKRWSSGKYQDPAKNMFRHHPLDYIEAMQDVIIQSIKQAPEGLAQNIIGIGVDTTGSTPAPVDIEGTVLSLKEEFSENPNAMFILWKDHTAVKEADLINKTAKSWGGTDFTQYCGGIYSSEWFFSKILHILRNDLQVKENSYSWVELADWIPAILTGNINPLKMKRSRCAAGHKAMWHSQWEGLPPEEFLIKIDPLLSGLRSRLYSKTYTSDAAAGTLTKEWADKLGLNPGVTVTVGAFDPHMGAVGGQISEGIFVKVLGTSCCDMAVGPKSIDENLIDGICGQVDGSIIPGMIGYEAGQSSFGDVYAWFKDVLCWPLAAILPDLDFVVKETADLIASAIRDKIIKKIEEVAQDISPQETGLIALDWLNGRRTPYADQKLKGAIAGLSLGSTAPKIYRALVEATAFGSRAIVERFRQDGLKINEVVAIGGIPKKSPLVMQILADVLGMPVKVAESSQTVALGAAIFGAVAAGYYDDIYKAQEKMASKFLMTYYPEKTRVKLYNSIYKLYIEFGNITEDLLRKL
ncbi:MAG: ribulokinase [Actinobacteria bacterium]|nr:ribulokinase [Actinomycetota bacterium]MBM3712464.1 ribulokinase [Actinomycetota bacterium]